MFDNEIKFLVGRERSTLIKKIIFGWYALKGYLCNSKGIAYSAVKCKFISF